MDTQRTDGPGMDPGLEAAEANGVRLATAIDPRLAEVWTTLFAADLDAADLAEQIGWFLRMGPPAGLSRRALRAGDRIAVHGSGDAGAAVTGPPPHDDRAPPIEGRHR